MSSTHSYAVFGLGRYGYAVAKELVAGGADVLAVDAEEAIVNAAVVDIPLCKCADVTSREVLKQLGVANMDTVVVAMAGNLEASVLTVMLCKEIGVRNVVAKCASEMHRKILGAVGADKVILPEVESGTRLAKNLLSSGFVDVMELSNDVSVIEIDVKPEWVGKTLVELNLRKKYAVNVIAIRSAGHLEINIDPTVEMTSDMQLVVIVQTSKIAKLR